MRRLAQLLTLAVLYALNTGGCVGAGGAKSADPKSANPGAAAAELTAPAAKILHGVTISERPQLDDPPRPMAAARNEVASTVLQLSNLPKAAGAALTLRLQPFQLQTENAQIAVSQVKAWQVLSMPVDANRAGYVRHTGLDVATTTMPRALLPVPIVDDGRINVTGLRDPAAPLNPNSRVGLTEQPVLLWLDVTVPTAAKPGVYKADVDLLRDGQRVDSVPLTLTVYEFVLPDERHLHLVGRIEWDSLEHLYPDLFPNVTPELISRNVDKYKPAVKLLDQFVALAHEHRTSVVVPRLQPVVKWPGGQPPLVDWTDFDTVVGPWLGGGAFPDKVPLGYWPLPRIEFLDRYPAPLQMAYWRAAVSHFDQNGWLERAWVELEKDTLGRATAPESVQLSMQAAELLNAHQRLRVSVPLEESQLQFANPVNPNLISPRDTDRLLTAASGLVFAASSTPWPQGVARPARWLRTDLPGLMPYIGAGGDERDVRLWAWLAFLRRSVTMPGGQIIGWDGALPHPQGTDKVVGPTVPADPNELTWFYPGEWFGVDEPIPTVQLKWLRRAQQDYEYLLLAYERGQVTPALVLARLMTKQVQTRPNEDPDPTHGLLSGTTDPRLWDRAVELLARNILIRPPGRDDPNREKSPEQQEQRARDEEQLNREMMAWIAPQDKPLQMARTATWGWAARPGNWVDLRLGMDIYNASDQPLTGELQWVSAPRGWEFDPQPVALNLVNSVGVFQVKSLDMRAAVDLSRVGPETRQPITLRFVDSIRNRPSVLSAVVPVAASDRREGALAIDGALGDWDAKADALQDGRMVVMLDRASLQKQAIKMAGTESVVLSNWAKGHFYVAFKLDGISTNPSAVQKNDPDYQLRRAWGSDLCEILIQPVYANKGDVGQVVHVACKPRGQLVVETKPSPRDQKIFGAKWNPAPGADIRFATATEGPTWRGEMAIPWNLINDKNHQGMRPTLMRFNFVQYKQTTGESSSWAGPVDYGMDDTFMGLLYLRDLKSPGMGTRE